MMVSFLFNHVVYSQSIPKLSKLIAVLMLVVVCANKILEFIFFSSQDLISYCRIFRCRKIIMTKRNNGRLQGLLDFQIF